MVWWVLGTSSSINGQARLNYLVLPTILLEIELVLNTRPLCELYDIDYEEQLTPSHLLFGRKLSQLTPNH